MANKISKNWNELSKEVHEYGFEIRWDLSGKSWDTSKTVYYLQTIGDRNVGISEQIISPIFSDMMKLKKWWSKNKKRVIKKYGD